jgi:hypothetical protein
VSANPAVIWKLPNFLGRHGADPLGAIDCAACAPALPLRGRVPPELPRGLRLDRGDKVEEHRDSHGVNPVTRGSTERCNEDQEANERHRRLTEPQHDQSMGLPASEVHAAGGTFRKPATRSSSSATGTACAWASTGRVSQLGNGDSTLSRPTKSQRQKNARTFWNPENPAARGYAAIAAQPSEPCGVAAFPVVTRLRPFTRSRGFASRR